MAWSRSRKGRRGGRRARARKARAVLDALTETVPVCITQEMLLNEIQRSLARAIDSDIINGRADGNTVA